MDVASQTTCLGIALMPTGDPTTTTGTAAATAMTTGPMGTETMQGIHLLLPMLEATQTDQQDSSTLTLCLKG